MALLQGTKLPRGDFLFNIAGQFEASGVRFSGVFSDRTSGLFSDACIAQPTNCLFTLGTRERRWVVWIGSKLYVLVDMVSMPEIV